MHTQDLVADGNTQLAGFLELAQSEAGLFKGKKLSRLDFIAGETNRALSRAISEFPHGVNAVEVKAIIDISRPSDDMPNNRLYNGGRPVLRNYLKKVLDTDELPKEVPFTFIRNLPWQNTTGMNNRIAERYTYSETVGLLVNSFKEEQGLILEVNVTNSLRNRVAHLYLDEVQSVRFVNAGIDQFSPLQSYDDQTLEPAPRPLADYLSYRGFMGVVGKASNILTPWDSTLWKCTYGGLFGDKPRLSGFFAVETADDHVVYQLHNAALPKRSDDEGLEQALKELVERNPLRSDVKVFEGNNAIRAIHEFDPKRGQPHYY